MIVRSLLVFTTLAFLPASSFAQEVAHIREIGESFQAGNDTWSIVEMPNDSCAACANIAIMVTPENGSPIFHSLGYGTLWYADLIEGNGYEVFFTDTPGGSSGIAVGLTLFDGTKKKSQYRWDPYGEVNVEDLDADGFQELVTTSRLIWEIADHKLDRRYPVRILSLRSGVLGDVTSKHRGSLDVPLQSAEADAMQAWSEDLCTSDAGVRLISSISAEIAYYYLVKDEYQKALQEWGRHNPCFPAWATVNKIRDDIVKDNVSISETAPRPM